MNEIKYLENPKGKSNLQENLLSPIKPLPGIPTNMICKNCCKYREQCISNHDKDTLTQHLKFQSGSL